MEVMQYGVVEESGGRQKNRRGYSPGGGPGRSNSTFQHWQYFSFGRGYKSSPGHGKKSPGGGESGAHINPAVTIALATIGKFPWADVPLYIIGQFIGAFLGAVIVWLHYLPHWEATEDKGAKLAVFSTGPAIRNTVANLLSEIIGTFVLVLGVPVERPGVIETTALGAAYLAGLAVGFWQSKEELAQRWQLDRRFESQMGEARRESLYSGWRRAVKRSMDWATE